MRFTPAFVSKESSKGMRLMEDGEQKEALEKIVHSKDNVETQLRNLPLIIETPSLMKLKSESPSHTSLWPHTFPRQIGTASGGARRGRAHLLEAARHR